ncbi:sodium:proton antiporter NhaD [Neolewinella lacunae]|uniref:Sodium:proton antiporter NhaD n=1 Tax=Neolewinella lacunae TaxID=1517758 RepID=A0A923T8D5_9BACT|nr:sodium:proton antiporter NhaD [Neolewinella lacunae]MBC6995500.1 sodium:proton antiporter NhaD [Neolewinella lacunae]MDN3635088.1 sodium:proton antiporter NhaD [Neolewinella lacunae]
MLTAVIACFIIGYIVIVFEHPLRLDKTVPALLMGALCWALLSLGFNNGSLAIIDGHEHIFSMATDAGGDHAMDHLVAEEGFTANLLHHLGKTAEILIFLIGAMTIVEIVDLHRGFDVLKGWVRTRSRKRLLWIVGGLGFILSAIIDNLTATIVLVTLLRKLVPDRDLRIWYVSLIVIAANAGGAWSPIGDVTTTMLWIGKRVSTAGLMEFLIVPSIVCFALPFLVASFLKPFQGEIISDELDNPEGGDDRLLSSRTMLFLGLGMIVFVPIFKTLTHLPPYLGMMLSLGVVWLVSEYIHPEEDFDEERKAAYSAHKALSRIEMSSILFFLGILMAVAALETIVVGDVGALRAVAESLQSVIPNQDWVIFILGFLSAIIDNVPLVAASMGMYDLAEYAIDDKLWHFIAYSAGTGGSMLIIGSAAGVAAMGMERIDFIWYFKKISWLALIGFAAGAAVFVAIETIF